MKNPLLQYHQLPPFKTIRLEHIIPALDKILINNRLQLEKILSQKQVYTWKNLIMPLEEMEDRLHRMWYPVKHLHSVMDSMKLREIYSRCLSKLSEYNAELLQNTKLYRAIQNIVRSRSFRKLNATQQKIIKDKLRDFKLSGVTLQKEKKQRFIELMEYHNELMTKFGENVLDAMSAWNFLVRDETKLSGLPEYIKTSLKKTSEEGVEGFLFTLNFPIYHAVMTYADDTLLREIIYEAYMTRASDQGPNADIYDNTSIMKKLLKVRQGLAQLVGFKNYAEYSLATKMAKNPKTVMTFLNDLVKKVRPIACREFKQLQKFAAQEFGIKRLYTWDIAYYSEKLRKKLFDISDERLRPFFPEDKVLSGMFTLVSRLYGIKIKEGKKADVWHKDVRFFRVYDNEGKLCSYFYTDLYAREHKQSGAWAQDYCARRRRSNNKIQKPVAYMMCNFNKPTSHRVSLLTHSEVLTLFHEFGHCLHHLLSKADYIDVSGWNGLEWDAVELPSQFMENFCWQKSVIDLISAHYKTGESLPKHLLDNLLKSKNFHAGMKILRQLEFSLFDFRLHLEFSSETGVKIQKLLDEIRKEVSIIPVPKFNRFQHSFSHIFSGSYAAGYYSYKWAEVLSSDAFSKFEEEGLFNKRTAQSFLHNILEKGGSQEAMELFVKFRGRKPKIDAMLKSYGILNKIDRSATK